MIEIVAEPSSLTRSAMGSITGQIFLRGSAASFPEEGWSDFPVVILGWWIQGLGALANRKTGTFQGMFMDGPYAFVVQRFPGRSDEISWGRTGAESPVGIVDAGAMLASAVAAARAVVTACRVQGWAGPDLDSLEGVVERGAA
jgi:hypothetical protein